MPGACKAITCSSADVPVECANHKHKPSAALLSSGDSPSKLPLLSNSREADQANKKARYQDLRYEAIVAHLAKVVQLWDLVVVIRVRSVTQLLLSLLVLLLM